MDTYVIKFSIYATTDGGLDGLVRAMHVVRKAPVHFHDMTVIDSGKTKEVTLRVSGEKKNVEWLARKLEKVVEVMEVKVQSMPTEISLMVIHH